MTPTIPKGMKPFDVNEAMQDVSKVRTRTNDVLSQISFMKANGDEQPVISVIEGCIRQHSVNGRYMSDQDSIFDLFLIDNEPEKPVIRICKNGTVLIEGDLSAGVYGLVKID